VGEGGGGWEIVHVLLAIGQNFHCSCFRTEGICRGRTPPLPKFSSLSTLHAAMQALELPLDMRNCVIYEPCV
jgi:hypothetical protein